MILQNILNFTKALNHTFNREDLSKLLDNTLLSINEDLIPTLDAFVKSWDTPIIKNSPTLNFVAQGSGLKVKDNKDTLVAIRNIFNDIYKSGKNLKSIVNDNLPEVIVDSTMTVKQAAIIKTVADINGFSSYTMDFLYYVTINGNVEDTDMPDVKIKQIREGIPTFIAMVKSFVSYDKLLKELPTLSDNLINVETSKVSILERLISSNASTLSLMPNTQGLSLSPTYWIYWTRMRLSDMEIAKLETIKEKKRLIELKLMDLKSKAVNEPSAKLTKQIEYYEDKISKMEYDIARREEKILN